MTKRLKIFLIFVAIMVVLSFIAYLASYKMRLTNSIIRGDTKTFKKLIGIYGTEVKLRPWWSPMDLYPIHITCNKRKIKMIKILVAADADLQVKDGYGRTCLYYVLSNSRDTNAALKTIDLLLNKDPFLVKMQDDFTGYFALHEACSLQLNKQIIEMLINYGASVDQLDRNGDTPLDVLMKANKKDEELISLLKSHLARSNVGQAVPDEE